MVKYEDFKANDTHIPYRDKNGNISMIEIPLWWRGSTEDVADAVKLVKKGEVEVLCKTPGGRDVTLIRYGKKNNQYVPDITLHLHGGGNCPQQFFQFNYIPGVVRQKIRTLADRLEDEGKKRGMGQLFYNRPVEAHDDAQKPPSFNIVCAWTAICGEPCIIYESNQGLYYEEGRNGCDCSFSFDEIYNHHKLLFETTFKYVKER